MAWPTSTSVWVPARSKTETLPSVNLNAALGENTVTVLWKQKRKNSSASSHTNTDVWFGFVHRIFFIPTQCNDSAFLILWPSVWEIASSFFDTFKCVLFLVYVAPAFDRWIPPWGAIKCIVSFHLISSHHLSYGLVQGNINNVGCRWVCLQVANI